MLVTMYGYPRFAAFLASIILVALPVAARPPQAPGPGQARGARPHTAARAAQVSRDTVRLIIQPPPTVNVEASSQTPTVVFGIVGALLLAMQLWIMARQTNAMNRQTALLDQQAAWRRDEAIGTFYQIAFDLADELRKANVMTGTPIPANYNTHPRQMLREASRLFASLGSAAVYAASETAMALEEYFMAVEAYNKRPGGRDGADRWQAVQAARQQVGIHLDVTGLRIPDALRWKYSNGKEYDFRHLCAMPPGLARAIGGPSEEETSPKDEET